MTLDILDFIPEKEGNPDEIRESQKKRGLSTEVVDEVIQMYKAWVKRTQLLSDYMLRIVSCEANGG